MSNDQPPGPPPEDDPFRKRPQEPQGPQEPMPPGGPPPGGQPPPGGPPPSEGPYGAPPPGGGGPYGTPPPGGGPHGAPPPGAGSPYGSPYGGPPPPYDPHAYGGDPYGGGDPLHGMPPLADSGKRILARIVDWLIVAIPLLIIGIPFGIYNRVASGDDFDDWVANSNTGGQWVFQLISIIAYVGYDTLMVRKSGQTLGKRLMKMRVAMLNDGSTPDTGSSLTRAAVLWLPQLICCPCLWPLILLILILVDKPYKQGLHDKAAKTVVVSTAS
ncbi:RDD family protein [Streptomyces chengbuensis]|uniref:RDD family protein n=1 Tax=Streptomyces TaxID=1883 RepID=UPI0025B5933C|nr:RDD family protein [Streptomyces sp. HUAS CB01]WJY50676.1 RDD family protein [Streptomyces sp. HUAS CB01]